MQLVPRNTRGSQTLTAFHKSTYCQTSDPGDLDAHRHRVSPPQRPDEYLPTKPTCWSSYIRVVADTVARKLESLSPDCDPDRATRQMHPAKSRLPAYNDLFESKLHEGQIDGIQINWTADAIFETSDSISCLLSVAQLNAPTEENVVLRHELVCIAGLISRQLRDRVRHDAEATVVCFTLDKIRVLHAHVIPPTPDECLSGEPAYPRTHISIPVSMDIDNIIGSDSNVWAHWTTLLSWILFHRPDVDSEVDLAGPVALKVSKKRMGADAGHQTDGATHGI